MRSDERWWALNTTQVTASPNMVEGAFARFQPHYEACGIAIYPLDGGTKRPAIRRYDRIGTEVSRDLVRRFSTSDAFGFAAGSRSGITVIDIDSDDRRLVTDIQARFGETPVQVRTPSGGWHLYYRHAGEARQIRALPSVDVLGRGNVVAAGAVVAKGRYELERGGIDDLARLPRMRGAANAPRSPTGRAITTGERNRALFRRCMRHASSCDSLDALIDVARTYNEDALAPPLPDAEVIATASSAWAYEAAGVNRFGATGVWFRTEDVMAFLRDQRDQDAYILLSGIRALNRPERLFCIANGWAPKFGWTRKRFAAARDRLVELGWIVQARRPAPGVAAGYRWGSRAPRETVVNFDHLSSNNTLSLYSPSTDPASVR
jgi:hypothetical protein